MKKFKMKSWIIDLSKIVIFLSICVVLLRAISPLFVPKNNNEKSGIKYENARGFYGEDPKTVDVLAIGNSDLYSAMNPLQLWKDQGYTSYVCAEPQQNIFGAYYMLKEVLSCQKPKVVILEVDELFSKSEAEDVDEAINNALKYTFPLFEYHSRWKDLKIEDFNDTGAYYNTRMNSKGYLYHDTVKPYYDNYSYMNNKKKHTNITSTAKAYLKKFINLANENGAEVLFVWFPSATTATQARHNVVQKLADSYDIPFIDFNVNQYDTEFNWLTDSRDGGNHLNYSGATKMTKYLSRYLNENYDLIDHRENPEYDQWNKDYESFIKENKINEK